LLKQRCAGLVIRENGVKKKVLSWSFIVAAGLEDAMETGG